MTTNKHPQQPVPKNHVCTMVTFSLGECSQGVLAKHLVNGLMYNESSSLATEGAQARGYWLTLT
jgi:hypothetical protein